MQEFFTMEVDNTVFKTVGTELLESIADYYKDRIHFFTDEIAFDIFDTILLHFRLTNRFCLYHTFEQKIKDLIDKPLKFVTVRSNSEEWFIKDYTVVKEHLIFYTFKNNPDIVIMPENKFEAAILKYIDLDYPLDDFDVEHLHNNFARFGTLKIKTGDRMLRLSVNRKINN